MSHVLGTDQRTVLAEFAHANVLVAFDFDGTLAPIVDHPQDAALRQETRALLRRVCELYPCAVITGRSREDATERLRGLGLSLIVGNHGADTESESEPGLAGAVQDWKRELNGALEDLDGVWVEDKVLSLAVHFRGTSHDDAVNLRVRQLALPGARVTKAKKALNIVSADAADKGHALERARVETGCDRVIFVGDDDTDEDVFTKSWSGALLGIRVGDAESAAQFRLRDQTEIDGLLKALIEEREPASGRKSSDAGKPGSSRSAARVQRQSSGTPR